MPVLNPITRLSPEYFPGLETMRRIGQAERCFLLGENQYSRQSFQNRAKIRNADGWQWLTVPLESGEFGRSINEMIPSHPREWKTRHMKGLQYNYSTSPFYEYFIQEISDIILKEHRTLADLTCSTTIWCARAIGLDTEMNIGDSGKRSMSRVMEEVAEYEHPSYRQNFPDFIPGMSVLDVLFNHGPEAKRIILQG